MTTEDLIQRPIEDVIPQAPCDLQRESRTVEVQERMKLTQDPKPFLRRRQWAYRARGIWAVSCRHAWEMPLSSSPRRGFSRPSRQNEFITANLCHPNRQLNI